MRLAIVVAALVVACPAIVFGGTHKVPQQFATINAALAASAPGDTIKVGAGTFFENVAVSVAGVKIVGKGNSTIIDARTSNLEGSGPAILILANGVTIESLTVRHAKSPDPGNPADVGGNIVMGGVLSDITVRNVRSLHPESTHVTAGAGVTNLLVEKCTFEGAIGIDVHGTNVIVKKCAFKRNDFGLLISSVGGEIRDNTLTDVGYGGFIDCNGTLVRGNKLTNVRSIGVILSGVDCTFQSNTVSGSGAVIVTGTNATIEKNKISHSGGDVDSFDQIPQAGITLDVASGAHVVSNTISDCALAGIWVTATCTTCVVENNVVQRCGGFKPAVLFAPVAPAAPLGPPPTYAPRHAGIFIEADGTQITSNTVKECAGDGILVMATLAVLTSNACSKNLEDGIDVDGTSANVTGNTSKNNHAEGLDFSGNGHVIVSNVASGNRVNWRLDGTPLQTSGNTPSVPDTSDPCVDHD